MDSTDATPTPAGDALDSGQGILITILAVVMLGATALVMVAG
jgi:hypothetical protein